MAGARKGAPRGSASGAESKAASSTAPIASSQAAPTSALTNSATSLDGVLQRAGVAWKETQDALKGTIAKREIGMGAVAVTPQHVECDLIVGSSIGYASLYR